MAEQVAIDLLINSAGAAKTVGELKQSLKDLKSAALNVREGSKEFQQLTKAAALAKDRIEDVNDGINALNPDKIGASFAKLGASIAGGFQAASGAAALFGANGKAVEEQLLKVQAATALAQGIQSVQDLGKAFKAFFLVLKANPITLILTAVTALIGVFVALKDKVKIFGEAFDFVSGLVEKGVQFFKDLSDSIGLSNFALDDQIDKLNELAKAHIDNVKTIEDITVANLDREIKLRQAQGREVLDLELQKQDAIREAANKARKDKEFLIKSADDKERADLQKQIDELIQIELNAANEKNVLIAAKNKELSDKKKEIKKQESIDDFANAERDAAILAEIDKKATDEEIARAQFASDVKAQLLNDELIAYQENKKTQAQIDAEFQAASFQTAQVTANSLQALSDAVFAIKMGHLTKGSAAEERAAKKQFKINKALALTQNIISTVLGITNALAQVPYPLNIVQAVAVGIAGTAGTAKIASTQYGGGASGGVPNLPSVGEGGADASRGVAINPVSSVTSTQIDPNKVDEGKTVIKAYVVESDLTKTQQNVGNIVSKSKI